MTRHFLLLVAAVSAAVASPAAGAQDTQEKKTWIPIYVTPYYMAADTADGIPSVAVNNGLNELMSSTKQADILAGRDHVLSNPATVTPFSLMVMAIRMYDTGLRDESVLWFYIGKYRAVTLLDTVTFTAGPMSDGVRDAVGSFVSLAGPYINGYAFCDTAKQQQAVNAAIDWVEAHPYQTIYAPGLKDRRKPGDINANLKKSIADIRASAAREAKQLNDPAQLATFKETRKQNGMDEQFCWAS
ncbi:MAG: hypothetical protein ABMA14_01425 [Hyphomonadaceae bacterium]